MVLVFVLRKIEQKRNHQSTLADLQADFSRAHTLQKYRQLKLGLDDSLTTCT